MIFVQVKMSRKNSDPGGAAAESSRLAGAGSREQANQDPEGEECISIFRGLRRRISVREDSS